MSNVEAFSDFLPDQRCLMSCLRIKFRQGVGTAFFIRYGQKHFLVTADHVVSGLHDGDNFAFQFNDTWIMSRCNRVIRCNIGTDVAMIIGEDRFHKFFSGQGFDYSQLIQGVLLGGIVAYLGFPLGLNVRVGIKKDGTFANLNESEAQLHMPFQKKGIIGGIVPTDWGVEIYVDSLINKGFSGGPLICNVSRPHAKQNVRIADIVVRFHYDSESYLHQRSPDGTVHVDNHTFVRPNSGYAVAIGSKRIKDMIDDNFSEVV